MAVTSQVRPGDKVGEAAIEQWEDAGLLKASVLKPLLATIERGLVRRNLGRLVIEPETLRRVLDGNPRYALLQLGRPNSSSREVLARKAWCSRGNESSIARNTEKRSLLRQ